MSKVSTGTRACRSQKIKKKEHRTRTRFLLHQLRDQVNSGNVDPELQKTIDVHFGTLYRFRMKS